MITIQKNNFSTINNTSKQDPPKQSSRA